MKPPGLLLSGAFLSAFVFSLSEVGWCAEPRFLSWAEKPPLGWNSWDIFGTTVTEEQVKQQADAMQKHLLPSGYDILTVDIQWYEPDSKAHVYKPGAKLEMDAYGRLTPGLKKFPSAAGGKGFKPLADYVHSKGLRFGIHIMRGIPRQAVEQNTPVFGADATAKDIALTDSTCSWNPDMFGVNAKLPAGQAYYDSIFKMYAEWGLDFVKVDDISRPYDDVQKAEIEAIRKSIDKTGRKIVLSLSPGATPVAQGDHVKSHANMWRITDDFWDRWGLLYAMFERTHAWAPHRRPGSWPDADMLPIGVVDFGRKTHFTRDEQFTLMSLWSIAKSPLIFGGDMTKLDDFTLGMLTNTEMLAVNQNSSNNRQISREKDLIVWAADLPGSKDKYVALFNARSSNGDVDFKDADYASPVISGVGQSQEVSVPIKDAKRLILFVKDAGDGFSFDHAAWVEPVLKGPGGVMKLTNLKWKSADSGWGKPEVNKTCEAKPLIVNGKPVEGLGTHSESMIIYDLPDGYETFSARGVVLDKGTVVFGVLADKGKQESSANAVVSVSFKDLGIAGSAQVFDVWENRDLGEFKQEFSRKLPPHGAGLYRIRE
jgi:alpha-galactosidase